MYKLVRECIDDGYRDKYNVPPKWKKRFNRIEATKVLPTINDHEDGCSPLKLALTAKENSGFKKECVDFLLIKGASINVFEFEDDPQLLKVIKLYFYVREK